MGHRCVPPQRVWFLRRFGLKMVSSLESEKVFDKTTYLFFQLQMNKEEKEICKLEDNFVSFIDNFIV